MAELALTDLARTQSHMATIQHEPCYLEDLDYKACVVQAYSQHSYKPVNSFSSTIT